MSYAQINCGFYLNADKQQKQNDNMQMLHDKIELLSLYCNYYKNNNGNVEKGINNSYCHCILLMIL